MKKAILFALAAMLALALSACGTKTDEDAAGETPEAEAGAPADESPDAEDDLAYLLDKGTLIIGITEYEPMNYYDESGKLVGFDTEFAEAVCAKLGLTPEFEIINWDTKEIELNAKSIDCIWNGLTVTEERRANMAFSDAYLRNEQVVVARAADAGKYADVASLAGVRIVAEAESAGEGAALSDIADAEYTAVSSQENALLEIKAGTADAAVIDATMAGAMTGAGTDYADLAVLENIDLTDEEYAIGFRTGSTAVTAINDAIAELASDGTLDGIAEKYGLAERLVK
ncbi:MAG: transporter substrate-binding domain-containing protein [Clostridiales Family XIII bacterium]|jgi:polar amino acid transport system substrate-binding protein|nr:transporter substrate-binding domain-containing protein [Clostridiales Family XIII bacterium]